MFASVALRGYTLFEIVIWTTNTLYYIHTILFTYSPSSWHKWTVVQIQKLDSLSFTYTQRNASNNLVQSFQPMYRFCIYYGLYYVDYDMMTDQFLNSHNKLT